MNEAGNQRPRIGVGESVRATTRRYARHCEGLGRRAGGDAGPRDGAEVSRGARDRAAARLLHGGTGLPRRPPSTFSKEFGVGPRALSFEQSPPRGRSEASEAREASEAYRPRRFGATRRPTCRQWSEWPWPWPSKGSKEGPPSPERGESSVVVPP